MSYDLRAIIRHRHPNALILPDHFPDTASALRALFGPEGPAWQGDTSEEILDEEVVLVPEPVWRVQAAEKSAENTEETPKSRYPIGVPQPLANWSIVRVDDANPEAGDKGFEIKDAHGEVLARLPSGSAAGAVSLTSTEAPVKRNRPGPRAPAEVLPGPFWLWMEDHKIHPASVAGEQLRRARARESIDLSALLGAIPAWLVKKHPQDLPARIREEDGHYVYTTYTLLCESAYVTAAELTVLERLRERYDVEYTFEAADSKVLILLTVLR